MPTATGQPSAKRDTRRGSRVVGPTKRIRTAAELLTALKYTINAMAFTPSTALTVLWNSQAIPARWPLQRQSPKLPVRNMYTDSQG